MASITLLCSLVVLSLVTLAVGQSYPYQCKSYCDPHILPFPGGRTDVHQDGVQIPGTFKLATFGSPTVVVYENHYDCGNGVHCNDKAAIVVNGHSIVIISDDVYVDGAYVTPSITPDYTVDAITTIHKVSNGHYIVDIQGVGKVETSLRGEWMNIDIYVTNPPPPGPDGGLCHPRNGESFCPGKEYPPESLEGFACSYYVPDDESPFIIRPNPTNPPDVPPATPPPKPEGKSWEEYAAELCGPILNNTELRDQCGRFVNVELFYAACYSDVVLSHQLSFSGGAIDAYAATCANLPEGERFVLPTSAISSTATGITSPIRPGSYHFTIQAKDVLRRDIRTGGETWAITSNGPAAIQSRVTDNGNGSYDVSFTVRTTGIYSIGVWHRGSDPIANSPFRVVVQ